MMHEQKSGIAIAGGGIIIQPIDASNVTTFHSLLDRNATELCSYSEKMLQNIRNLYTKHSHINDKLANQIKDKRFYFGIYTTYGQLIGCMCIYKIDWRLPKADLFYFIENGYQGVGMFTRSFNWFIAYCFSRLDMEKLGLNIDADNVSLYQVAIKNGFKKEVGAIKERQSAECDASNMNYYGLWRIQQI